MVYVSTPSILCAMNNSLTFTKKSFSIRMFSSQRVPVPVMGESITQGVLASWSVKVGDNVNADDVVGSIETDKVNGIFV